MPKLVQATAERRTIRLLVYGKGGSGKTHLCLSAPGPAIFDAEGKHKNFVGVVPPFQSVDYDKNRLVAEFAETVQMAMAGRFSGVETLVGDSWTMIEKAYRATMNDNLDGKQSQIARGRQRERIELDLLDPLRGTSAVNIIFTAHEANEWSDPADGQLRTLGKRPDGTKNLEHYFDIVMHLQYDKQSRRRTGTITKSNVQHLFPVGKVIQNPTWADFEPLTRPSAATEATQSAAARPAQQSSQGRPAQQPARGEQTQAQRPAPQQPPAPAQQQRPATPARQAPASAAAAAEAKSDVMLAADGEPVLANSKLNALFRESGSDAANWVAWLQGMGIKISDRCDIDIEERARASVLARKATRTTQGVAA